MTEQDQQIALCKWMGWKYHKPTPEEIATGSYYQYEPDTSSLDMLHIVEIKLTHLQREEYLDWLDSKDLNVEWNFVHATAPQRREALLRTLGLWKE